MKSLCNHDGTPYPKIPVMSPSSVESILTQLGLVFGQDYTQHDDKLILVSPREQSMRERISALVDPFAKPNTLEVKFKWKEISYDGLIRDPSKYGPEWDQETVNGWGGGYDTEDSAIAAMVEFKAKHDLRYEYTLMKIYK